MHITDDVHVLDPPPDRVAGWPLKECGDDSRSHFAKNARNDFSFFCVFAASQYERLNPNLNTFDQSNGGPTYPILEIEQVFHSDFATKSLNTYGDDDIACFYHRNRCAIKANGDIIPCGYFDTRVAGNLRRSPVREIWQSMEMQQIKNIRIKDIEGCRGCNLVTICSAGCRAIAELEMGSITSKDPFACNNAKFMRDKVLGLLQKHGFEPSFSPQCSDFEVESLRDPL